MRKLPPLFIIITHFWTFQKQSKEAYEQYLSKQADRHLQRDVLHGFYYDRKKKLKREVDHFSK